MNGSRIADDNTVEPETQGDDDNPTKHLAALLALRLEDQSASRTAMVGLMRRYSKWTLWSKRISRLPKVPDRNNKATLRKRQRVVKLSPEQIADLIAAYQDGQTVYNLAARFNIHRVTVSAHLHRHGITLRRQGLNPASTDHAVRLYTEGTSLARIGTYLNVDAHTIRTALKKRGVPMRDTHGRTR